jgi:hypothetical protein
MKILILGLLLPSFVIGQTSFTGTVINKNSKEKIPFVSVGLMSENIGTNADENGHFTLASKSSNVSDTLLFSCIGFSSLKYPV